MKSRILWLLPLFALAVLTVFFFSKEKVKNAELDPDGIEEFISGMKTGKTDGKMIIDVPLICQYPELPTGCESVSAAMVLQYYGVSVTAEEFAGGWLERSEDFYETDRGLYGPDPHEVFAGNPFSEYAYGCFAPVIVRAVNGHCAECRAEEIDGKTLPELCSEYIDQDMPLLIWATMYMKKSYAGRSWYLEDGTEFVWTACEHCLVLVGYDEENYFLNDPLTGNTEAYPKELVEKRFQELGSQAVLISRKQESGL